MSAPGVVPADHPIGRDGAGFIVDPDKARGHVQAIIIAQQAAQCYRAVEFMLVGCGGVVSTTLSCLTTTPSK
jgi:hypothetical protein